MPRICPQCELRALHSSEGNVVWSW